MLWRVEGKQRRIQPVSLPIGVALAPIAFVRGQPKNDFMVADVLRALVLVSAASSRRANQSEANSVIAWLIGAVFLIGQDGFAERAALVGEVDPLVGCHLELAIVFIGALDGPDVPVISC